MVGTVTNPYTKLFIPTRLVPTGRRLMSVARNDLTRYVSFPDFEQAQDAIDALRQHDLVHVTGEVLTCRVQGGDVEGEMIVWESSLDEVSKLAGAARFGIDVCEFVPPHFVLLRSVYVAPLTRPDDHKRLLEDIFGM